MLRDNRYHPAWRQGRGGKERKGKEVSREEQEKRETKEECASNLDEINGCGTGISSSIEDGRREQGDSCTGQTARKEVSRMDKRVHWNQIQTMLTERSAVAWIRTWQILAGSSN